MFLLYYILSFVFYGFLKDNKVLLLWFCFLLLVIIKNQYYDILVLLQFQVNVFYTFFLELEGRLNEMGCDQFKYSI
jgi:hypothetical protein